MHASILDGKFVSTRIQEALHKEIISIKNKGLRIPGLAVVLIGNDPASNIYVNNKKNTCEKLGFKSYSYNLDANTEEKELLLLIDKLNNKDDVDGIIVQLPLPSHINTKNVIETISPHKDVDGFHPYNLGRLALSNPNLRPCTPYGIITLFEHYNINLRGKHAVIVGASNIVGRPMALEFLMKAATVTICHSATQNLKDHIKHADIIVTATGKLDLIDVDWLNEKQIIIDVGIIRMPNGKIRGEIDFDKAKNKVAWITPVPGGIGPMTICMLLKNTLQAYEHYH